jgi:tetratricopeptide (TPR) repeat protein
MRTEIRMMLADVVVPDFSAAARGSELFRVAAQEVLERDYITFRRFGKVDITVQGEIVCIVFTTDDNINPMNIAVAELQAGRLSEGVSLLKFLNAGKPRDADVLYLLGSALSDMGDLEHAEAYLRRALEVKPDFSKAMINLGVALIRMQQPGDAIEILEKAVKLDPNNQYAHRNLGACIGQTGRDAARAQFHLEFAIKLDPKDPQSWGALAILYRTQGKTDAASAACKRVLEIGPPGHLTAYAQEMLDQMS